MVVACLGKRSRALLSATVFGLAAIALCPREAHAQTDAAAAESQFQEGRKLMEAKRYAEACPKFLASYKLAPAAGTLLNLADCYEKNGQIASAWSRFQEAIKLAQRTGRPDREKTARDRAEKLEPRLSHLTVDTVSPNAEVKLDGKLLEAADLGNAMLVDPGKHTIEATGPGKLPFSTTIEVAERKNERFAVPVLEDEPRKPAVSATPAKVDAGDGEGSTQRTLGIVGMAAGGVGLAVGTFFGVRTSSKWSDAQARCTGPSQALECDALGVELAGEAKSSGNLATASFIVGSVLVVGGAVLYFTAPSGRTVRAGVGPGSVVVGGTF